MEFRIISPLTSAPRRQQHTSAKVWKDYKPLMLAMRMQGETAEQIQLALHRKGFKVGIGPVKRHLSDWAPKNCSHRRSRLLTPTVPRHYRQQMDINQEELLTTSECPDVKKISKDGPDVQQAQGELSNYEKEVKGGMEKDMGKSRSVEILREPDVITVAADILKTLGLRASEAITLSDCPTFEEWTAKQECSTGPKAGVTTPLGRYGLTDLMRMVKEIGEPERVIEFCPFLSILADDEDQNAFGDDTITCPRRYRQDTAHASAIEKVELLLHRSIASYNQSSFLASWTDARDAFAILKTLKPMNVPEMPGYALFRIGAALFGMEQQYPKIIQTLRRSRDYFKQSGSIEWELKIMGFIGRVQAYWPACDDERRRTFEELLERVKEISAKPSSWHYADVLWDAKSEALEGLSSLLPPELAVDIKRARLNSVIKRRGPTHVRTAFAYIILARTLDRLGLYSEAVQNATESHKIFKAWSGALGVHTIETQLDTHYFLVKSGKFQEAFELYREELCPIMPKTKPWTANRTVNVGRMLSGLGRHQEALQLFQRGINGLKQNHQECSSALIETEEWIADALYRRGLVFYAQPVALDYMNRCEKVFGKHDRRTLDAILFCLRWGISVALPLRAEATSA